MLQVLEAMKILAPHVDDDVVVSTMTVTKQWINASGGRDLDLPLFGCMGKASSMGLGLALAQPNKRIVVIDGDGSLLMNLGTLATISGKKPRNFIHILIEDGAYTTTGGQPIPAQDKVDFEGLAREAGYSTTYTFTNLEDFASQISRVLTEPGPVFVCLRGYHQEPEGVSPRSFLEALAVARRILKTT